MNAFRSALGSVALGLSVIVVLVLTGLIVGWLSAHSAAGPFVWTPVVVLLAWLIGSTLREKA